MRLQNDSGCVRAVIFDLDGTLTDTEKYFQTAWAEAGARFGYALDREKTLALRSLGMPFVEERLKEWFGESCRAAELKAECHSIFNSIAAENGVQLKPGAKELLAWLKDKGVVIALATAGTAVRAEKQLAETGVIGCFDKIICSNMVARGKPAPDTYLHACGVLGVSPKEAIAVEDSPNGVKSAYAAGCKVIMVPDQTEPDDEIKPMLYACASSLGDIIRSVFTEADNLTVKQLDGSFFEDIKRMLREVFGAPPWNEDWSDDVRLDNYLKDLTEVRNPIIFGLFEHDALIGVSIGRIKHWCGGTEYFIEELCLRAEHQGRGYGRAFFSLIEGKLKERGLNTIFLMTDRDKPAYGFYKKIGCTELPELTSFFKSF